MANIDKAFTVPEDGLSLNDKTLVIPVVDDPSQGAGVVAPAGSIALRQTVSDIGEVWRKHGTSDTDWHQIDLQSDLQGEPTGFPPFYTAYAQATLSFVDGTRTFTITPIGDSFTYYIAGRKHVITTSKSVVIPDTSGYHYIYFDNNETLVSSLTRWQYDPTVQPVAMVSAVYWNASDGEHIFLAEERHGYVMDWMTHLRIHVIDNLKLINPIGNILPYNYTLRGDGSTDDHVKFALTEGTLVDEDLFYSVVDAATPAAPFEQTLSPAAKLKVVYLRTGDTWAQQTPVTDIPLITDPGNTIKYNKWDPVLETWTLTNASEGYFVNMWVVGVNDLEQPIIMAVGAGEYENLAQANFGARTELSLVSDYLSTFEALPLYRFVYRTSTSYTNTSKAVLYSVQNVLIPGQTEDRYPVKANYNGNAGAGKYLEIFAGQSSDTSPWTFTDATFIRALVVNCTSTSTGTISVYKLPDLTTPVMGISLTAQAFKSQNFSNYFADGDQIALKVSSGSLRKPAVQIMAQTT